MRGVKRLLVVAAIGTAALTAGTAPALAEPLGSCNGSADSMCTYCGHYSGNGRPYPYSYCHSYPGTYRFHTCYSWALGHCYVG